MALALALWPAAATAAEAPGADAIEQIRRLCLRESPLYELHDQAMQMQSYAFSLGPAKRARRALRDVRRLIDRIDRDTRQLQLEWAAIEAQQSAVERLRDIKILQFAALDLSLRQLRRYITTRDPTHAAYAKDYFRQQIKFRERFEELLTDLPDRPTT